MKAMVHKYFFALKRRYKRQRKKKKKKTQNNCQSERKKRKRERERDPLPSPLPLSSLSPSLTSCMMSASCAQCNILIYCAACTNLHYCLLFGVGVADRNNYARGVIHFAREGFVIDWQALAAAHKKNENCQFSTNYLLQIHNRNNTAH